VNHCETGAAMQKQCKVWRNEGSTDEGERSVHTRETSGDDGVRVGRITQTRESAEFITNRVNLGSCSWVGGDTVDYRTTGAIVSSGESEQERSRPREEDDEGSL
jgi:hypothetical protein